MQQQPKHDLAPVGRPLSRLEDLLRDGRERGAQIGAQALGRLVGHLDAVLEHRDRELG